MILKSTSKNELKNKFTVPMPPSVLKQTQQELPSVSLAEIPKEKLEIADKFGFTQNPTVNKNSASGPTYFWKENQRFLTIDDKIINYSNNAARTGKNINLNTAEEAARKFLQEKNFNPDNLEKTPDYKLFQFTNGTELKPVSDLSAADLIQIGFKSKKSGKLISYVYITGANDIWQMVYLSN